MNDTHKANSGSQTKLVKTRTHVGKDICETVPPPLPEVVADSPAVALPAGCSLTLCGLQLREDLSHEEWRDLGRLLARRVATLRWAIGDWLHYGERRGYVARDRYDMAEEITGHLYDRRTLRNLAAVAGKVESSRRRDDLSWSHHADVASLPSDEQGRFLKLAAEQRWTRKDLREALAPGHEPETAKSATLESVLVTAERAMARAHVCLEDVVTLLGRGDSASLASVRVRLTAAIGGISEHVATIREWLRSVREGD